MRATYVDLLRRKGAAAFVTAGFVGRLPLSMVALGIVLLITGLTGSYALAGAMSAAYALATAFISPFGSRWMDRSGQATVLPVLASIQGFFLVIFTIAATAGAPLPVQFAALVAAGGAAPNVGSSIRARWASRLQGGPALRAAFALEAVVDEIVFVVGPPLVTTLAVMVDESFALFACVGLVIGGSGWLASQRSTQPAPRPRESDDEHAQLLSSRFAIVTVILFLVGGIFGAFEVTTVAFTSSLHHEELTGVVLALYAFGSLISGLVLGALHLTAGAERQLLLFAAVLAVVTIPLPFVHDIVALMIAAFLAGMAVSPVLIVTVMLVETLVSPGRLTEALTIGTSGSAVGLAIAATLSGALVDSVGPNSGYWVMAGCAIAAFGATAVTFPVMNRHRARGA